MSAIVPIEGHRHDLPGASATFAEPALQVQRLRSPARTHRVASVFVKLGVGLPFRMAHIFFRCPPGHFDCADANCFWCYGPPEKQNPLAHTLDGMVRGQCYNCYGWILPWRRMVMDGGGVRHRKCKTKRSSLPCSAA